MWKIALFLVFTLIAVPILTFYYDEPLTALQLLTMKTLLWVYGIAAAVAFIVSTITKNYSQVDKLWSTIPIAYGWIVAVYADFEPRITLMAVLITIWAVRLTYNFGRRGGYSWKFWTGDEDYRWSLLRAIPSILNKYEVVEAKFENGTVNKFSPAHPYWVVGKGWCVLDLIEAESELSFSVNQLAVGDTVIFYLNGILHHTTLLSIEKTGIFVEMYNLEFVKNNHCFFANGILVHNKYVRPEEE